MGLWSRLRRTFGGRQHAAEIEEELRFHLDMDMADGHDSREARLRLGNPRRIEEDTRAAGIVEWLESAIQDVRMGFRQLRKTPALTIAVVLSLAIGTGANTAIFSLIDAALLKPLPVTRPDQLIILDWTNQGFPPDAVMDNHNGEARQIAERQWQGSSIPAFLYRRLAREQTAFDRLIGVGAYPEGVAVSSDTFPAQQVAAQYVSSNFFEALGVPPSLGRPFTDDEDRIGAEPVVVVSHRFWVSKLGRSPAVLQRSIKINTVPARIVGVAPEGFFGMRAGQWPDVYAPLAAKALFQPAQAGGLVAENDKNWWVRQFARVKPGIATETAQAQLSGLFRRLVIPEGVEVAPQNIPNLVALPGRRGLDALNRHDRDALWTLMLLVGVVLLIVCANVANLLLARSVGRQKESAVRLALGAGRLRLFRQHLIESIVCAMFGGTIGLALGYLLARGIHVLFQTGRDASNAFDLHVDLRVLGFTGALTILTAALFGLAPAIRAARADLNDTLKAQTRSVVGGRLRMPRLLVSIQLALCLTALVSAGLLGRTLEKLKSTEIGFDRENLSYATVTPSRAAYPSERIAPYADRVRDALARLPGVTHVAMAQTRLLSGGGNNGRILIPGRQWDDDDRTNLNRVSDGFFEALRLPLLAGRPFNVHDLRPDSSAIVVDEAFAKRYFPDGNAVGRRLGLDPKRSDTHEIVGVVGNTLYNNMRNDPYPTLYQPYSPGGTVHFAIRSTMNPVQLGEGIRQVVASIDPAVPLTEFHTQTSLIDRLLRTERLLGFVSGVFGLVALTVAAIGLGGLLAYAVARRTNEIGVRMAFGAASSDVVRLVVRDSLWLFAGGILLGLPCAYVVGRTLRGALFRLEPLDPQAAGLSFLALLTVALVAAWIPARRAARVDPVVALREE
jgi:predicted permease